MAIRDLIPWKRERTPARRQLVTRRDAEQDPFVAFRDEARLAMDRMFDEFWGGRERGLAPWSEAWSGFDPKVDVIETESEVKVAAELPGLAPEDVHVTVAHNVLSIKGEKKHEREETGENWTRTERSYGSFQRAISLPQGTDAEQAEAAFEKGVLTVTFAKTGKERAQKIAVKTA
jgi:HSP20 family protein